VFKIEELYYNERLVGASEAVNNNENHVFAADLSTVYILNFRKDRELNLQQVNSSRDIYYLFKKKKCTYLA